MQPETRRRLDILMARKIQRMNEALLRCDIAYVLAAGDHESMDEGWPHHGMIPVPGWPERPPFQN